MKVFKYSLSYGSGSDERGIVFAEYQQQAINEINALFGAPKHFEII